MSEASTEQTKDQLMSAARSAAITRLRETHLDEFNRYLIEETKKRGLTWSPRKTPEEKAAEEMARILQQFPELAERVNANAAKDTGPNDGPDFTTKQ